MLARLWSTSSCAVLHWRLHSDAAQPQDAPGAARRPVGAALLQALRAYAEQFLEAAYEVHCLALG